MSKKILFVDFQKEVTQDLNVAHLINSIDSDIDLRCINTIEEIQDNLHGFAPDLIVMSYEVMKQQDAWDFGNTKLAFYANNRNELNNGAEYGIPTIGIASNSNELLEKLSKEPYSIKPVNNEKKTVPNKGQKKVEPKIISEPIKQKTFVATPVTNKTLETLEEDDDELYGLLEEEILSNEENEDDDLKSMPSTEEIEDSDEIDVVEEGFQKDLNPNKGKTKVITVYSAKGGVGKTTIASELSVYLANVNIGRRKLRVCLVDYNIDFGNVASTLNLKSDGNNLTYWAAEVQEYMGKGKKPSDIKYTKEEIEEWLKLYTYKNTNLYVLQAPLTNEDSMSIESESLRVILDNIIYYGDFDFIVCDTGNNTRDSTMIALERADTILLIMTQSVSTANCDVAFMDTMKSIDFDMSHARLIINNIMPKKSTGITVHEIEESFPYECVGKIRFNTDVIKASNLGKPLSLTPEHDFTKQMRNIVAYVMDDETFKEEEPAKKKSFFNLFLRKNKEE